MYEIFTPVNDFEYLTWIVSNPDGYVANLSKRPSDYFVLHRASCFSAISLPYNSVAVNAFVGEYYRKICCVDADVLLLAPEHADAEARKPCQNCRPFDEGDVNFTAIERAKELLRKEAERIIAIGSSAIGNDTPRKFEKKSFEYIRSLLVTEAALKRSNGFCKACEKPAPFNRFSDGAPYLEVHHITPLSDGGADTLENVVALCPNCHREVHLGGGALSERFLKKSEQQ